MAGIGAILPYPEDGAEELASLFALTRFVGEGAGGQIVRYAIDRARDQGLAYLFSCTTSERSRVLRATASGASTPGRCPKRNGRPTTWRVARGCGACASISTDLVACGRSATGSVVAGARRLIWSPAAQGDGLVALLASSVGSMLVEALRGWPKLLPEVQT